MKEKVTKDNHKIGDEVRLFETSEYWGQSEDGIGIIMDGFRDKDEWVEVIWENGHTYVYQTGDGGIYDLYFAKDSSIRNIKLILI